MAQAPKPALAAPVHVDTSRHLQTHFSFRNVDVGVLEGRLARLGVHLPIALKGKITARIGVAVPWRSLLSAGAYELTGDISSPQLTVEDFDLHKVAAKLRWAEGVLTLDDLRFALDGEVEDENKRGQFDGSARMQVEPRGQLSLSAALDGLTVATLAKNVSALAILREGRFSGQIEAAVPVNDIRSPAAWSAHGQLHADDVNVEGIAGLHGDVGFEVRQANARTTRLVLEAPFGRIEGEASAGLSPPLPFELNAIATFGDLRKLESIAGIAVPLAGHATATLSARGNGQPATVTAHGLFALANVSIEGITIPTASGGLVFDGQTATLSDLHAVINGGEITGAATIPVASGLVSGLVNLRNVRLEPFSNIAKLAYSFGGSVSGDARFSIDREQSSDWLRWTLDAQGVGNDLRVAASQSRRLSATLKLANGTLSFPQVRGDLDGGTIDGRVSVDLREGHAFESELSVVNLDVGQLSQLAMPSRPLPTLAGRVSARANVRGTLQPLQSTGTGSFGATGFSADGVTADRVSLRFALGGTHVDVTNLDAALLGGSMSGTARIAWQDSDSNIALNWTSVDLAPAARAAWPMPPHTKIVTNGWIRGHGPPKSIDLQKWTGKASANATATQNSQTIAAAGASIVLDRGVAHLSNGEVNIAGGRTNFEGDIALGAPVAFHAKGQTTRFNLALAKSFAGASLPLDVAGTVDAQFDAHGTLQPLKVTGRAAAGGQTLHVGNFLIDSWNGLLTSDGDVAKLDRAAINAYDGQATLTATLPLAGFNSDPGALATIDAAWQHIDLARLPLVSPRRTAGLQAETDGDIHFKVPVQNLEQPNAWTWHAALKAGLAERGGVHLGGLESTGNGGNGRAKVEAHGTLLDGRIELNAAVRTGATLADFDIEDIHFLLDRLQLSQLSRVIRDYSLRPLRGTVSASAELHRTKGDDDGTGALRIEGLGWGNVLWSDHLAATFRIGHDAIDLVDTSGSLAGGTLEASGQVPLGESRAGHISLGLSNVRLQELLEPWPGAASLARGTVDLQLRGRLADVCRFEGIGSTHDAKLAGLRVSDAQFPFNATWDPRTGRAKMVAHQGHAQLARGRMTSRLEVDVLHDVDLRGNVDLTNVDLNALEASFSPSARFGSGTVQGSLAFAGKNVRSVNDLTGTLHFKLRNAQAMTLPVLQQIGPLLSAGVSTATRFNDGDIRGSLSHGVVRLKKFTLTSPSVQVFASGDVALAGRLDLELVARTGQQGANGPLATLALNRLALTAAGPVGWVIEANELLSNRVINAHVSGNIRHPTIQIRPVALLEQEALRFFLGQAAGGTALP